MKTLKAGDKAPEFKVKDQDGIERSLADYHGKRLVVFFYPRANTPGCTAEACNLRDHYSELKDAGYELLGVSEDNQRKQLNFKKKFNLPFPLLADTGHQLIDGFGVWGEKKFMGRVFDGIHRKTFVIDEQGMIQKVIDKVDTKDHAAQLL